MRGSALLRSTFHLQQLQLQRWGQLAGISGDWRRFLSFEASHASDAAERVEYTVTITTGRRRGAGTADPVSIQLIGAAGQTDKFLLDNQDNPFERGSSRVFRLPAGQEIGPLRRVHIEKRAPSGYDPGRGWFLKQVLVESTHGQKTLFPCNSWLGDSDCGAYKAPCERNLLPAAQEITAEAAQPVHITAAGMAIPHPEKVTTKKGFNQQGSGYGGEDAYFFCEGRNQLFGMGVADGVYGWRDAGIDSGVLAQSLMRKAMQMIQGGVEDVYQVLHTSSHSVLAQGIQGSCTACVLTINKDSGQLHAANLGDSGFMVLGKSPSDRGGELQVKFRTSQMEHEFGRPLQLGHHEHASRAEHADLVSFYLAPGDVIVMGSDGLFDNVNESEIMAAVSEHISSGPSKLVHALTNMAFEASVDKKRDTPYARDASEAFNMVYQGGKPDDISVIVARVRAAT